MTATLGGDMTSNSDDKADQGLEKGLIEGAYGISTFRDGYRHCWRSQCRDDIAIPGRLC